MVSVEEVLRVARLARIQIPEADLAKLQQKFSAVLESFAELNALNTEGVEPLFQGAEDAQPRQDIVQAPLAIADLQKNAPDFMDDCFRLPRVVGTEE